MFATTTGESRSPPRSLIGGREAVHLLRAYESVLALRPLLVGNEEFLDRLLDSCTVLGRAAAEAPPETPPSLVPLLTSWLRRQTAANARDVAAEIVREKVFRWTGDELPYSSTVVIDKFETEGRLRRGFVTILVDRDAHKAMIIGAKGAKLKQISTEARMDMEKLFDGKVYLEVWIKVKSGWADNEAGLRAYGYE